MSKEQKLHIANLRLEVIKLALSPRSTKLALTRMLDAGVAGRKEASEIGRNKFLSVTNTNAPAVRSS